MSRHHIPAIALFGLALVAALPDGCGDGPDPEASAAPTTLPQPTRAQFVAAGLGKLPVASQSARIDVSAPTFSNPTRITNPLFPISDLHSAVFSGRVEGKPFHTETTLLPETRLIEWAPGQVVETRISQYFAYIEGRIEEVALDYYAQADDGSVWYFGEDLFDYDVGGLVDSTEGNWLAGRDGPPAMIMPGHPKVGEVHRAENIPGTAFEEITVKTVDKTVNGPARPVKGALVESELHDDGARSDKIFAPGYGEFFTGEKNGDVEAMALAVPTDALNGPPPPDLEALSGAADETFHAVQAGNWNAAGAGADRATSAWDAYRRGQVPPRLASEMRRALDALAPAIRARDRAQAGNAAIDVAQSALDFELRYRPPAEIDRARFELWARQVLVDAAADDLGGVRGDVTTMEWIRDRFAHTLAKADLTRIDAQLVALRDPVTNESMDLGSAAIEAARLRDTLAGLNS
jgi:hypothetical protein